MNKILKNLAESHTNGRSLVGAIENALAAAINAADPVGGWSVKLTFADDCSSGEFWAYQDLEAGSEFACYFRGRGDCEA